MAQLSINQLYVQVWGYWGPPQPKFETNPVVPEPEKAGDMKVISANDESDQYDMKSALGTPIRMPVKLGDYWLPNEPLVTLTGGKNIVKTVVTGLKGTVKEEISTNDYLVVIKGIIVNEDSDDFPEKDVAKLKEICEAEGSHDVVSKLFRIFGIEQLSIESWQIIGIAGEQSQQAYQINAWSDRPVELILREGL